MDTQPRADADAQAPAAAPEPRRGGSPPVEPAHEPLAPPSPWAGMRLIVPALIVTALLVVLAANLAAQPPGGATTTGVGGRSGQLAGFALDPPREAPAFVLTAHTGEPIALADARGKAVLLFFGFASCPDVCPTTLLTIARALEALGEDAERVAPIFVSVDPDRDTPQVLAGYVAGFDPRITGATADLATLEAVAADYGVQFQKVYPSGVEGEGDYTMDHTATIFLIDPAGRLRAAFLEPTPDDLAHDLRLVLGD